ncbi:MAG: hypothetical protein ACM31D_20575 [Bacteroidota bacterium]
MESSIDRLSAAVEAMHRETVACRRNLMVFRARMETAEQMMAGMAATLEKTGEVLAEAEADARRAGDIFRATAEGHSAEVAPPQTERGHRR